MKAATTMDIYDLTPHKISIHAAREGGDGTRGYNRKCNPIISIHAAREGGDGKYRIPLHNQNNFNPRRP